MKDWFKANVHLQDLTRQEDEQCTLVKNSIISSLVGVGSQANFASVLNTVMQQIPDQTNNKHNKM